MYIQFKISFLLSFIEGVYINEKSCMTKFDGNEWNIVSSVFDCEKLISCNITCGEPNKEKIKMLTRECGCLVEWIVHSVWLEIILVFIVYVLLNISRVFFLQGLAYLFWNKIHPSIYTLTASCNIKGELLFGNTHKHDGEKSKDSANELSENNLTSSAQSKLRSQLRMFNLTGGLKIFVAILLNVFWIYIIFSIKDKTRLDWLLS